jgi:xylulokinase
MLAAVACGEYASVEEIAEKMVHVNATVKPDPEIAARYEAQYQKFVKIYPAVKALFPQIG